MVQEYVSHSKARSAVKTLESLIANQEDIDAVTDLFRYIEEYEYLEDRLMTALDNAQRKLEQANE